MTEHCTALIVDDDEDMAFLTAEAIRLANDGLSVAGIAYSGHDALRLLPQTAPDVVVLDFRMPGRNGLEVAADILAAEPDQKIVLFSAYLDDATVEAATDLGVRECVSKDHVRKLPDILRKYCPTSS